jgi:hypothetical protein
MHFISQPTSDGVSERLFTLGGIPGVLWSPAGAGDRPLVLNPGGHQDVPAFELESSERFFARHLAG